MGKRLTHRLDTELGRKGEFRARSLGNLWHIGVTELNLYQV